MFQNSNDFDFDDSLLSSAFTTTTGGEDHVKRSSEIHQNNNLDNTKTLNTINQLEYEFISSQDNIIVQSPSRVIKRKFPGPAGILPNKKHVGNKTISELVVEDFEKHTDVHEVLCSQNSTTDFEDSPWQEMCRDFLANLSRDYLPDKYNIEWIKSRARLSKLINQKAPFLAAVIQSLDISNGKVPTINVSLKDKSGEIQATVLYNLYDEYSKYFTVGSVLVLKQFGVLTAGLHSNHYLTITPNNLLTIYCKEGKSVQKISVQDISVNQIVKSLSEEELVFEKRNDSSRNLNNCSNKTFINNSNSDSIDHISSILDELKRGNQRKVNSNKPKPLHDNKFKFKSANQNDKQSTFKRKFNFSEERLEDKHISCQPSSSGVKKPTIFESSLDDLNFNDDFDVPDNFEETVVTNLQTVDDRSNKSLSCNATSSLSADTNLSVHNVGNKSDEETRGCDSEMSSSQISVKGVAVEHEALWQNAFADVDAQAFFDEF